MFKSEKITSGFILFIVYGKKQKFRMWVIWPIWDVHFGVWVADEMLISPLWVPEEQRGISLDAGDWWDWINSSHPHFRVQCLALSAIALSPSKCHGQHGISPRSSLHGDETSHWNWRSVSSWEWFTLRSPGIFPLASVGFANPRVSAYINLAAGDHNLR